MRIVSPRTVGVVLAGGRSSRMGTSKALLSFKGQRLIDRALAMLSEALSVGVAGLGQDIVISGNLEGYPCVPDRLLSMGPIGGLEAIVSQFASQDKVNLLVVPIDMPALTSNMLRNLIVSGSGYEAAVFQDYEFPLYLQLNPHVKKTIVSMCLEHVPQSMRSIKQLLRQLDVNMLDATLYDLDCFYNVNTPVQWDQLKRAML